MKESNFEILSNNIPGLWLWEKDIHSTYTWINKQFAQYCGLKNNYDLIGKTDSDIPCGFSEFASAIQKRDQQVIGSQNTLKFIEILKCANDQLVILLVHKMTKLGKKNIPIGTIGHGVDITAPCTRLHRYLSHIDSKKNHYPVEFSYRLIEEKYGEVTLPKRQSECLFFYLRGRSAKEIGQLLNLSPKTIEYYIEIIKAKYGCQNKSELFDKAMYDGFFTVMPESLFNKQLSLRLEQ